MNQEQSLFILPPSAFILNARVSASCRYGLSLLWHIVMLRPPSRTLLTATPATLLTGTSLDRVRLASNGTTTVAMLDNDAMLASRDLAPPYTIPGAPAGQGGDLTRGTSLNIPLGDSSVITAAGGTFLFAWSNNENGNIYGRRLADTGAVTDADPVLLSTRANTQTAPAVMPSIATQIARNAR